MPSHSSQTSKTYEAAEFFAGVGLVGEALKTEGIQVVWANDIEQIKQRLFDANHDSSVFHKGDIRKVEGESLPNIDLATASFPCTDVSLAGNRAGLAGEHSGMFWEFTRVLEEMGKRKPRVVLLENVVGFFSSNGGEDLKAAFEELNRLGYYCDLILVDAKWFVPQSRPRVFIVGSLTQLKPNALCDAESSAVRPVWFREFIRRYPDLKIQTFALPAPSTAAIDKLSDVVERFKPDNARWWSSEKTEAFVATLSEINSARLGKLKAAKRLSWRTAYRRTRNGKPVWEIRDDEISGCLRTAKGGSSKQAVVEAGNGKVRVRWMTAKEYASLQGVPDFKIDHVTESQAMFGFGDAVCVPAVRYIGSEYLVPLLSGTITEGEPKHGEQEVCPAA